MADYLVEHALPAELSALVNARAGNGWTLVSVESVVTEWHCVTSHHGYERREAIDHADCGLQQGAGGRAGDCGAT